MSRVVPRLISLQVDTQDRSDEVSKAVIASGASDSGFMSFAAARSGGGRDYTLQMTIAQDHADGTLWSAIWDNLGGQVDGVYAPYGNATPSATQPHYEFTATIAEPDGDFLGAEASDSLTDVATVDVEWKLTGKPTKVVA